MKSSESVPTLIPESSDGRRHPFRRQSDGDDLTRLERLERSYASLSERVQTVDHRIELMAQDARHWREVIDAKFLIIKETAAVHGSKLDNIGLTQQTMRAEQMRAEQTMLAEILTLFSDPDKSVMGKTLHKEIAGCEARTANLSSDVEDLSSWKDNMTGRGWALWIVAGSGATGLVWQLVGHFLTNRP